jgi:hypothetical protein
VKADRHNKLLQMLEGTGGKPVWDTVNSIGKPIRLHQVMSDCPTLRMNYD